MESRGSLTAARSRRVRKNGMVAPPKTRRCVSPPIAGCLSVHPVWVPSGTAISGSAIPPVSLPSASTAETSEPYAGPGREDRVEGLERYRAAIGKARMPARRGLDSLGDPTVQIHQTRAQQRRIVDGVAKILRVLRRLRRIGGSHLLRRRRPDAEPVLGAGEVVHARRRTGRGVARALGVRVGERGVAAVVLG